jgi:hypothetical protein
MAQRADCAVTSHTTLKEVERHTQAVEQKKLASAAIGRLEKTGEEQKFPNLGEGLGMNDVLMWNIKLLGNIFDSPTGRQFSIENARFFR